MHKELLFKFRRHFCTVKFRYPDFNAWFRFRLAPTIATGAPADAAHCFVSLMLVLLF